ncbi:hypothetical protein, partial [Halomonas saccharevitans]|uniref:hypothetical protein n=1 Tax=Halomonas saccharevitans TaxID=416872 RepID=UPI001C315DB6
RIIEAAVLPAPCEEGVFYMTGVSCQPVEAFRRSEAGDRNLISPERSECRSSGVHSTECGEFVKREFSKRLRKTQMETSTSTTITACNVCPLPAADAYFTDFPGTAQGLDEEKCQGRVAAVKRR